MAPDLESRREEKRIGKTRREGGRGHREGRETEKKRSLTQNATWKPILSVQLLSLDLKWHNLKFIMKSILTVKNTDFERSFYCKNIDAVI